MIEINKLKRNQENPRFIDPEKLSKLKNSISGFEKMLSIRPIIVDSNWVVLGGNMRLQALIELGYKSIPKDWVRMASELTEEEKREFIIKDNVGFGQWDWDLLQSDWDVEELEEWGMDIPEFDEVELEAEEDDYIEPEQMDIDVVQGDLIEFICEDGRVHRLLCGDSTDGGSVEKLMKGNEIEIVFTDPPYNIDYQGVKDKREKIKNDKMPDDDFVRFIYDSINLSCDTFYVCCSWQYSHLFREAMEQLQKPVKSFIIWDKVNPAQHLDKYFKQHEIILYHGKFGGQKTLRGDVWQVKRERNTVHPTMKPIPLISMALNDHPEKSNVYDSFLGSGSTMVASHQVGKTCYGCELEPKYCQVIIDRMVKLDDSIKVKINGNDYVGN